MHSQIFKDLLLILIKFYINRHFFIILPIKMFYNNKHCGNFLKEKFDNANGKKLVLIIFVSLFILTSAICIIAHVMRGPAFILNVNAHCVINKSRLAQDNYLITRFPDNENFIPLPTWIKISVQEKFLFFHIEHAKTERRFVDENGEYLFYFLEIYNDNHFRPWFFGSDVFIDANYACMSPNKTQSICLIKQTIHMNRCTIPGRVYAKMFNAIFRQDDGEMHETKTFCV